MSETTKEKPFRSREEWDSIMRANVEILLQWKREKRSPNRIAGLEGAIVDLAIERWSK